MSISDPDAVVGQFGSPSGLAPVRSIPRANYPAGHSACQARAPPLLGPMSEVTRSPIGAAATADTAVKTRRHQGHPGSRGELYAGRMGRFYRFFTESFGSGADVLLRIRGRIRYRLCATADKAEPQCSSGSITAGSDSHAVKGVTLCTSTMRDERPSIGDDRPALVPQQWQPHARPFCWRHRPPQRRRPRRSRQRRRISIPLWASRPRWVTRLPRPS